MPPTLARDQAVAVRRQPDFGDDLLTTPMINVFAGRARGGKLSPRRKEKNIFIAIVKCLPNVRVIVCVSVARKLSVLSIVLCRGDSERKTSEERSEASQAKSVRKSPLRLL